MFRGYLERIMLMGILTHSPPASSYESTVCKGVGGGGGVILNLSILFLGGVV